MRREEEKAYIPGTNNEEVSIQQQLMEVVWRCEIAGKHQSLVRPNCTYKQTSITLTSN